MKSAGSTIPAGVQARLQARVEQYAREHLAGRYTRIEVAFRGSNAYIDLYTEPEPPFGDPAPGETREQYMESLRNTPTHLCRLGYQGSEELWRFAFYSYAHERYEPSVMIAGLPVGPPEDALDAATLWRRVRLARHCRRCPPPPMAAYRGMLPVCDLMNARSRRPGPADFR
jgi:hypothetical protein